MPQRRSRSFSTHRSFQDGAWPLDGQSIEPTLQAPAAFMSIDVLYAVSTRWKRRSRTPASAPFADSTTGISLLIWTALVVTLAARRKRASRIDRVTAALLRRAAHHTADQWRRLC